MLSLVNTDQLTLIEKTLETAVEAFIADQKGYILNINALELRVTVKGTSWTGVVDKTFAKFVLDLDGRIEEELKKLGVEMPQSPHGIVALKVEDGSTDAIIKYANDLIGTLGSVPVETQIILACAILLALGVYKGPDLIKALNEPKLKKLEADARKADSAERIQLVNAVTSLAGESMRELQQPLRSLVNTLDPKDVILLPGQVEPVQKEVAKKHLEKGTRSKPEVYYIDQRYIVHGLTTKKKNEWEITLKVGSHVFSAKLEITNKEVSELLESFQDAHDKNSEIAPDFQVTARINAKGVQSAQVVGMGDPRSGSMRLAQALAEAAKRDGKK